MNFEEAFTDFIGSETFKEIAKQRTSLGGKYRTYMSRFSKGELKSGAIAEILLAHGYTIDVKRGKPSIMPGKIKK
jgi:hypothetical protein